MSQQISVLNLSIKASAALVANRFVTAGGAYPSKGASAIGVTQTEAADGDYVAVDVLGTAVVEAGAAVAANAYVESDASGKAITQVVTTGGGIAVGVALEAASAAGDLIEVLLVSNAPQTA